MRFFFGLQEIMRRLSRIETKQALMERNIMAQIDDLKAAIAAEDANIASVLGLVSSQLAKITELQNQLAQAISQSAPDLTPFITDVQNETAAMAAVLPPAPAPAPAPDPAPAP